MLNELYSWHTHSPFQLPLAIFFILGVVLGEFLTVGAGNVQADAVTLSANRLTIPSTCPAVEDPTSNSLLVVLLDRSGSLIAVPGATDPQHYSTSVTKSLAELWPGRMAVVPFQNNVTTVPHFGPYTLSDPQQKATLENQIDQTNSTIGGGTPLEAAMREGLTLLNGAPSGSRVVLITDGAPGNLPPGLSYQQQVKDITGGIIQQYCSEGFPISAFGLTITDHNANTLLDEITSGTGGTYQDVTSPENLATAVTSLYSDWQHLTFTQEKGQGGNYSVTLDSFVQQVTIVTFRTNNSYGVTLDDPNNQPVQGLQPATDNHYVIDKLNEGVFVAGVYTVHISDINDNNDPDAQVYALVKSPLHVKIIAPTTQHVVYGKPVEVDAAFFNGNNQLTPSKNTATLIAKVSLFVNGKQVGPTNEIVLTQQGNIFKGQTPVYKQAGQLVVQIDGSYQGDQRIADTNILLVAPPAPIPPCQLLDIQCQWQRNSTQVIIFFGLIFLILVLLIVFLILWLRRRKYGPPYGVLVNSFEKLDLATDFRRTPIHSKDIENKGTFNFQEADFDLVFTRNGSVFIETTKRNGSSITVRTGGSSQTLDGSGGKVELYNGSTIVVGAQQAATYRQS
ncbi:MAG TPA: vWA domain-containing protein [Ktedonobacteraceae bacterium]|nr:vWA domain-containing protein [Ktedonobacteraceae bacterium]